MSLYFNIDFMNERTHFLLTGFATAFIGITPQDY
jgi:hypothetical protein